MRCPFCGVEYERLPHTCDVQVNTVSIYYGAIQQLQNETRGEPERREQ